MKELVLLASEMVSKQKYYLYVLELTYQKILKIAKTEENGELSTKWRIGYITEVDTISKHPLYRDLFITSNECLKKEYPEFLKIMLNKASYARRIMMTMAGVSYGIIRIRQVGIIDKGKKIDFLFWGTNERRVAYVKDPWWVEYWEHMYSAQRKDYYENYLSKNKAKVFCIAESKDAVLTIIKILVF